MNRPIKIAQVALEAVDDLTAKIKGYERSFEKILPGNQPFVVRLDGVSFKRFTSRLQKPFDPNFTEAMIRTTKDLMDRSASITGFCQSDEITLISGPALRDDEKNLLYGGRVSKICSVLASLAAARFNHHLQMLLNSELPELGIFDARVFSVPDWLTCADVLRWRHQHDCRRNALQSILQAHYSAKQLHGRPIKEMIHALKRDKGVDAFAAYPAANVFGTFVKRMSFEHIGHNPISNTSVTTTRTRLEARSFDWNENDPTKQVGFVNSVHFQ